MAPEKLFLRASILLAALAPAAQSQTPVAITTRTPVPSGYRLMVLPAHPNHPSTYPRAISADGVLAGIAASDPWDNVATPVIAITGNLVSLPVPFDSLNFALGIGSPALVVGTSALQPVAWVGGEPLVLQPAAGLVQGEANDANLAGAICGTLVNDLTAWQRAIVWPSATSPGIALPLGQATSSSALAISDSGRVAGSVQGGAFSMHDFVGARWDGTSSPPVVILPLTGAMNCELAAVNDAGDAAGRCAFPDFSVEAVFHHEQTGILLGLGFLANGSYSEAHDVNNARVVVGISNMSGGGAHAFRWHDGVLQDLNDLVLESNEPFIALTDAVAINDSGLIGVEAQVRTASGPASRMAILTPIGP